MKKHIFGIAIFSLIVGSAVLLSLLFVTPPDLASIVLKDNYVTKKETSCFVIKQKPLEKTSRQVYDSSGIKIRQAILNWHNKGIDWEISVPKTDASVALHLFAKGSKGFRHVATEVVPLKTSSQNLMVKYSTMYISLNDFTPDENLYVVPELISAEDARMKNFYPKFSEESATPVIVNMAKN